MRGFCARWAGGRERFLATLIEDAGLAQRLMALHGAWMSDASATPMARDEASLAVSAVRGGGGAARGQGRLSAEHRRRVLDYCQERLSEKIGLQDLARCAA